MPSALLYILWEPEMCTAEQRVLLTITGPGPSFFPTQIKAGQRTRRGMIFNRTRALTIGKKIIPFREETDFFQINKHLLHHSEARTVPYSMRQSF